MSAESRTSVLFSCLRFPIRFVFLPVMSVILFACAQTRDVNVAATPGAWLTTNDSWEVLLDWESGPVTGMDNVARLQLIPRAATLPVDHVSVTPWMTVHGHGSGNVQPVVDTVDASSGTYRVSSIFFVMSGPWDLKISIRSREAGGDIVTSDVVVPVEVPAS